jgi:6-phospho-beta-glucosidase
VIARLTVLGGSSPSTPALVDALAGVAGPPPVREVVVHGRNDDHLRAVARYACARLAARVRATTDVDEALDGATLVLHQIRYGGLEGRRDDERFAEAFGLAADETLGPAALRCALRIAPALRRLAGVFTARCPDAWVINLANPLSISTAILAAHGVRCLGVCELPAVTVQQAAAVLDVPAAALEWTYDGFNHRGFVHDLRANGRDQLPRLVARLGTASLGGVEGRVIEDLGAIPLKSFTLLGTRPRAGSGRAAFLIGLGRRIFRELETSPFAPPPSLRRRDLRWYPEAVVPAIVALTSAAAHRIVVDVPDERGIVREMRAEVSATGVTPVRGRPPSARVAAWLDVFERHERAVLRAVSDPRLEHLTEALAADPLVAGVDVKPLADALAACAAQEESRSWASMSR